ncbi:MAG: nucleotidyltransferase domain-containing protein [Cyanobacteria bacterium J06635_15]
MIVDLQPPANQRIPASSEQIAEFCHRWKITEFALFGSVLRDDFRLDSDIDVLLTFSLDQWLTWDDWQTMQIEIETLFNRKVDLVSKKYLKNPYRRYEILNTRQVIYATEQS